MKKSKRQIDDDLYFSEMYNSKSRVIWGKSVARQLALIPKNISAKFFEWVDAIHLVGIRELRKRPGFHDEPLQGDRSGQRSIRLNRSYRAIYTEERDGTIVLLKVIEITKHAY